jgi:hypothetical protein
MLFKLMLIVYAATVQTCMHSNYTELIGMASIQYYSKAPLDCYKSAAVVPLNCARTSQFSQYDVVYNTSVALMCLVPQR